MDTNAASAIAKTVADSLPATIPIAVQITAMVIAALTPLIFALGLWLQNNKLAKMETVTKETHVIVNSQRTEMQESIKRLEAESKAAAAAAAEAVAERRMAEMNAANQAALREAIIEASKLASAEIRERPTSPALPQVAGGDPKTIVAEKIVTSQIVTPDNVDSEHHVVKQLLELLQKHKGKEKL